MSYLIPILIVAVVIAGAYYYHLANSPEVKGKCGEQQVATLLDQLPESYHVLNDVVFDNGEGTAQIDHIVISKYGILAIETKNYTGDIYGNDKSKYWTQVIATDVTYTQKWYKTYTYVTKNRFYNPVKQAWGHVFWIKEILKDYPNLIIKPVVVFTGTASLQNVSSNNDVVHIRLLLSTIDGYKTECIPTNKVLEIVSQLRAYNHRYQTTNEEHVLNIKAKRNKVNIDISNKVCPRCGGHLVLRNGNYGTFYGCSNYPNCRFTTN